MTHLFKGYAEGDAKFATIERDSKFCFTGQCHDMFDDKEDGKDCSILYIWVVFVSEIEIHSSMTFGIWFGHTGCIGGNCKDHSLARNQMAAWGCVAT